MSENVYQEHGYKDRNEYLKCLAEEYNVSYYMLLTLADALGPSEDFDGLISELESL